MEITGLGIGLALFLFTAFFAYFVSVRIGLGVVITEILLGILLGPSLFGVVPYGEGIQLVGELGAIFLLFVVGFEVNFKEIYTIRNMIIAFFGVLVPFTAGFFLAAIFGYSTIQAMFIGTALTATSIAITAYTLKELKYLNTPTAKAIIGAAVVDDVLALLFLSITTSISANEFSVFSIGFKIMIAVLFVVLTILAAPLVQKFLQWGDKWGKKSGQDRVVLILAVALAFAYSSIAEIIGLSAIVGAFMAGVTMHGLNLKEAREGAEYLEMVFAAIFFVSIGVIVDVKQIVISTFFFLLIAVAILSKIIGCMLPSVFMKFNKKDSFIIGVGMMPRGEIALVVGLIGITSGIIDQTLYGSIIAMTIITTILAPVMLSIILKKRNQTFKY